MPWPHRRADLYRDRCFIHRRALSRPWSHVGRCAEQQSAPIRLLANSPQRSSHTHTIIQSTHSCAFQHVGTGGLSDTPDRNAENNATSTSDNPHTTHTRNFGRTRNTRQNLGHTRQHTQTTSGTPQHSFHAAHNFASDSNIRNPFSHTPCHVLRGALPHPTDGGWVSVTLRTLRPGAHLPSRPLGATA